MNFVRFQRDRSDGEDEDEDDEDEDEDDETEDDEEEDLPPPSARLLELRERHRQWVDFFLRIKNVPFINGSKNTFISQWNNVL